MMRRGRRMALVLLTVIICFGGDQITKGLAKAHLPRGQVLSFAGDMVRLDFTENRGGVLSFESCLPEEWRGPVLSVAVVAFLGVVMGYLVVASDLQPCLTTALAAIWGGTFSNLHDRIAPGGVVVDFLSLGQAPMRTAIFNVADAAIVLGTVALGLCILLKLRHFARRSTIS